LWIFFYSLCDARRVTAPHKILPSSFEVIRIYPTCSLSVVWVGGVFLRIFSGKNFLNESVIMRAFSKFCRLIVSINFPFRSAAPSTNKRPPTTAEGRWGVLGWATASEVAGEALGVPHASGTVSSSSTAICSCLSSEAGSVGDLVACPLPAQSHHGGDGEGASAACRPVDGAGALQASVAVGDLSFGLAWVGAKHGRSVVWS